MPSFLSKTSFFLIVYLFLSHLVSPLLIKNNGYEIYDLQSNISDDFALEAADWTAFPLFSSSTPLYTECGSTYLLGGYEVLSNNGVYYRMFTGLPEHNSVHISITFFFIDRWEPQDSVSMEVSNTTSTSFNSVIYTLDSGQTAWSSSICGSSSADLPNVILVMGFLHTGSSLALTITNSVSNSNPNRGYNGFRDVRIISSLDHTLATSECSIAPTGSLGSAYTCPCPAGESRVSSTCTGCDDSCENCFGAGASSCITCKSNYVYDGTLCQPCDDTCLTCSGTAATQCLTCNNGDFLYTDGTCRSSCTGAYSPTTTTDGVQTCTLNCPSPKYIYSTNETCLDSCSSPFTNSPSGTNNYCNFPCSTSPYYSEGSCLSSCDSPYTTRNEGGYLYCDYPCQSSQYMMPDNTCGNSCDTPMTTATVNGKQTCKSPCSPSDSMYYYPDTSTCSSTCSGTSAQQQYYKTCTVITTTNKTQETITLEQVNTVTTGVGGTGLVVATIVSSSSPSGALVGVLAKTFAYVRYLQIVYSTQLDQLLETFDTSFIPYQISSTPPSFVTSEKSYKPVPALFAMWDIHPSFLMNFWSDMTSFGIAILALIVLKFLQIVLKRIVKKGDLSSYAKKGKVSAENFLLTFIYNSYGDIIFYALIEFKTTTFGSTESYVIIPFIAFFLLAGIALFIFHIYLLKRYQTLSKKGGTKRRKSPELKAFLEKYEGAEMFFKDFKTDSFMQQACLLFTTWRDALFNIIFIVLFDYPLAEVITIMVLNVLMLIYLAVIRPLKKPIEQVHQIASELLVLVLNSCIMTMAVLDYKGQTATNTREILGKVVIVINIVFNALIALVMAIKIIKILIRVYKARKGGISKMIEGLNTAKSGRESVYAISSEMNTLDKFSSRIAKLDEKAHDLTFEESAPKENPILASTAFDKYLGTGERLSIFFQTEKKDEIEEQNKNDGELGSPVRNPRLEPSSPIIVNPAIENQALQDNQLPVWDFQRVSKAWKSVFGTPSESDL